MNRIEKITLLYNQLETDYIAYIDAYKKFRQTHPFEGNWQKWQDEENYFIDEDIIKKNNSLLKFVTTSEVEKHFDGRKVRRQLNKWGQKISKNK